MSEFGTAQAPRTFVKRKTMRDYMTFSLQVNGPALAGHRQGSVQALP
jgi:hypothetical protein